jgi:hypothetical protein
MRRPPHPLDPFAIDGEARFGPPGKQGFVEMVVRRALAGCPHAVKIARRELVTSVVWSVRYAGVDDARAEALARRAADLEAALVFAGGAVALDEPLVAIDQLSPATAGGIDGF